MLEFNSILRGDKLGILMIFLKEVMDGRLMELSNESQGRASKSSSSLLGEPSHVVTEVVGVVFQTLLFELSHSLFSVASSLGSSCDITSRVTLAETVCLVELSLRDVVEHVGVLLAEEVVISSVLVDRENSVSFLDISELFTIGCAAASNIRMVHLNGNSVGLLNLLRSSSVLNSQHLIVA